MNFTRHNSCSSLSNINYINSTSFMYTLFCFLVLNAHYLFRLCLIMFGDNYLYSVMFGYVLLYRSLIRLFSEF